MDSSKQIAGGITFLLCAAIVVFLMLAKLTWPARPWPPKPDPYIEMAIDENFVEIIELPKTKLVSSVEASAPAQTPVDLDEASQLAPESGTNLANAGQPGQPAKVVTTDRPSPTQTKKQDQPKKPGPTIDTEKQQNEATAKQTENKLRDIFAKTQNNGNATNKNKDEGRAGRQNGNPNSAGKATSNSTKAGVTVTGLGSSGWVAPTYSNKIPSNEVGYVIFEVPVNADGSIDKDKVTPIKVSGLSDATIARCKDEIFSKRYTYKGDKKAESITPQVTFRFRDPEK